MTLSARRRWAYAFYVLAAFNLLAICAGLLLTDRLLGFHETSVSVNREWAGRLHVLSRLRDVIAAVNAPGNDVFESRDPDGEEVRLQLAARAFDQHLVTVRRELTFDVRPAADARIAQGLEEVEGTTLAMIAEARLIFGNFREGRREVAARHMAAMDRFYGLAQAALAQARDELVAIQGDEFAAQAARASALARLEYLLGFGAILLMGGALLYGLRLSRQVREWEEELRAALARAQAAEARLSLILESTSDGIAFLDRTGRVTAANRRAAELLEGGGSLIGRTLAELVQVPRAGDPLPGGAALAAACADPARGGQGDLEIPALRRTVHWSAQATRDAAGATTGVTLTLRDVTRAREVDRMKSDFVAFATHQLRTPLAGMRWLLELAGAEPDLSPAAREWIDEAQAATRRLIGLVNDLLDISRLEAGRVEVTLAPVEAGPAVAEVLAELGPLARDKGQPVAVKGDPGAVAMADRQLLRQVLLNLLSNAIKYTPPGGAIEIRIGAGEDMVRWEVRDSGIGIPEAARPRIFEKFFRADNAAVGDTEGTGLGLCLVRLLVARMDGRVWFESVEGAGTTFFVTLPRAGADP